MGSTVSGMSFEFQRWHFPGLASKERTRTWGTGPPLRRTAEGAVPTWSVVVRHPPLPRLKAG
jgi:hypothetical protein